MNRSMTKPHRDKPDIKVVLKRIPRLMPLLLLFIVICISIWLWQRLTAPGALPFKHVQVSANADYIPKAQLSAMVQAHLHGGFFSLDSDALRQGLAENPWVESVSFRRVWPDTVKVYIVERQPLARWNDKGIVSTKGDIFYPLKTPLPAALPQILAPMEAKDSILPLFDQMQNMLIPLHLSIQKLTVSDRLAWSATLSNGIILSLCRGGLKSHFAEFVSLYSRLIGDNAQNVVHVNLCYPNGLAIQWKNLRHPSIIQ